VYLVVTIDVEEEGLFSGEYCAEGAGTTNVAQLLRVDPIFREWGIKPSLLVTYPVASDPSCRDVLLDCRERWKAEIGAHLHPWNTPPFMPLPEPEPVPSENIPRDVLAAKLANLLDAVAAFGTNVESFRMGRFNLGPRMLSVLEESPIRVDSSIAPMRSYRGGPDHLGACAEPYFPDLLDPVRPGTSRIVEVPLTIVPFFTSLGSRLEFLRRRSPSTEAWIRWAARNLGAIPVQPAWVGLGRLKAGRLLHRARGGQVLSMFFHSSELLPGAYPHHPTERHVERFLARMRDFFAWLHRNETVKSVTLSELGEKFRAGVLSGAREGDR
jgi:hypothetical protein